MDALPLVAVAAAVAFLVGLTLFRRTGKISRDEAHRLVKEGAKLVDVRSKAEFTSLHLPGAINVPLADLTGRGTKLGPKDAPVVLYCASGSRSALGRSMLRSHGYTKVFNLGAMDRWN
jgi:phage shock protein E